MRVSGLRNLGFVDVRLPTLVGWFWGDNGAGKTSLLEALYLLSRGTSFRGRRFGALTTHGMAGTTIEGWLSDGTAHWRRKVSFSSATGREVAGTGFCVRLVGASMHALVEGEPELRRRFVDWNLFHVEPAFAGLRTRYRRAATQRNAWLRAGGKGNPVWDGEYVVALVRIAGLREQLFRSLRDAFCVVLADFDSMRGVVPSWRSGLPAEDLILDWLREHRAAEVARGYSFLSPARADFLLLKDGHRWIGSRGQNKLAGVLLQVAADQVVSAALQERSLWLLDDLGAELDAGTRERLLGRIVGVASQVLIASLGEPETEDLAGNSITRFHVEHGSITA